MEAIIGAVYLAEGIDGASRLVMKILGDRLATAQSDGADHKSRFQELAAQRGLGPPRYEVEASGPDHARTFHVTAMVDGVARGDGVGRSKKQAEQAAARAAVEALGAPAAESPTTADGAEPIDDHEQPLRETNHG
jgi:ribonuclease-3